MHKILRLTAFCLLLTGLIACGSQPPAGPLTLNSVTFGSGGSTVILTAGTGTVNVPITVSISGFTAGSTIKDVVSISSPAGSVSGSGYLQNPSSLTDVTFSQTYPINTNLLSRGSGTWSMYLVASNPTYTSNTVSGTFTVN